MFAEIAPDAASNVLTQLPWWAIILLSAVGSIGGSALTLAVGLWQLRKTEAYRRASRWEPLAELLWRERVNAYREAMMVFGKAINQAAALPPTVSEADVKPFQDLWDEFHYNCLRLMPIASPDVNKALEHLIEIARTGGAKVFRNQQSFDSKVMPTISTVVNAMRRDIKPDAVDVQTRQWFPHLPT